MMKCISRCPLIIFLWIFYEYIHGMKLNLLQNDGQTYFLHIKQFINAAINRNDHVYIYNIRWDYVSWSAAVLLVWADLDSPPLLYFSVFIFWWLVDCYCWNTLTVRLLIYDMVINYEFLLLNSGEGSFEEVIYLLISRICWFVCFRKQYKRHKVQLNFESSFFVI